VKVVNVLVLVLVPVVVLETEVGVGEDVVITGGALVVIIWCWAQ